MMRVPVVVAAWQYECCGEPFEIGSLVRWRLIADNHDYCRRNLGGRAPHWSLTVPVLDRIEEDDDTDGMAPGGGVVAGAGDLRVFLGRDGGLIRAGDDRVRLRLTLEDHHAHVPESVTPTGGRVRRIRSLVQAYELQAPGERRWAPRAGDVQIDDITSSERAPTQTWAAERHFSGFLVDLDVDVADGASSPAAE